MPNSYRMAGRRGGEREKDRDLQILTAIFGPGPLKALDSHFCPMLKSCKMSFLCVVQGEKSSHGVLAFWHSLSLGVVREEFILELFHLCCPSGDIIYLLTLP